MDNKIIIAIDGYSACGKSTTAIRVAKEIGYPYIDTGAMYRAVTLYFIRNFVTLTNDLEVEQALKHISIEFKINPKTKTQEVILNGLNVEKAIRTIEVSSKVSPVSALKQVRAKLTELQQKMGTQKGIVMDGRDIGTSVFPDAELKIFMDADVNIRATRRQEELLIKGERVSIEDVLANLEERDRIDTTRDESPLTRAEDAHLLDTTNLTIESQVQYVIDLYNRIIEG